MADPEAVADRLEEQARGESGRDRESERTFRVTGLADLLPDFILPPEGKQHVRNARRELLLAARSTLDAWIDRLERGATVRRSRTRIEIE
jgi:hypothetical protein